MKEELIMSVRPIEVQGSFPQSQKTGKIQEQMQQRGQVSQDIIAKEQKEALQLKRMQVNESSESEQPRFHQDQQKDHQGGHHEREKHEREKVETQADHPYKGKFIDFSG